MALQAPRAGPAGILARAVKLYVDRGGTAPSPRRVRMYLAEKGITVPHEPLELHRENRTREFRRRNPIGILPVLELDAGSCISESLAICRYFEELHPELAGWHASMAARPSAKA